MRTHVAFFLALSWLVACGGVATPVDGGVDAASDLGVDAGHDGGADAGGDGGPCRTDADGDGHVAASCGGDDCDDTDPNRYPGNHEVCDTTDHDEDCDPSTFGFRDSDGDGYGDAHCCNVGTGGARTCGTDCDDANGNVHPMQTETCNGVDDNCNGMVDEGAPGSSYFPDCDGDGYGDHAATAMMSCTPPTTLPTCGASTGTWVTTGTDCNDAATMVHPGGAGRCDCASGAGDVDADGHVATTCGGDDCNDDVATTHAGAPETCNGVDDDCDGRIDYPATTACVDCGTGLGCADECCARNGMLSGFCAASRGSCGVGPVAPDTFLYCDGPEDCTGGQCCDYASTIGSFPLQYTAQCEVCGTTPGAQVLCHVDADCPLGTTCRDGGSGLPTRYCF